MNRIVKLQSKQGGKFSASNNLVDFDLSANSGVYDLSKSYVNLVCSVDAVGSAGVLGGANGIYMPIVKMKNDDGTVQNNRFSNIALVKNMSFYSQQRGQIADIRRVDVLRNNLNEYMLNTDERESLGISSLVQGYDKYQQVGSIFRNINKEGLTLSKNVKSGVKIPLSQLMNFGNVKQFDTSKYGRSKLHLELNLDKVDVSQQYLGNAAGQNWARSDEKNLFKDMNANNPHNDKLFSKNNYKRLEDSPWWVGQVIRVSATGQAGSYPAITNKEMRIVEIEFLPTTATANGEGQIALTLHTDLSGTGTLPSGTNNYTGLSCDGDSANFTFNCDYAELVLTQVMNPQKSQDTIVYTEFSTEEHNANGTQNFQRQFQVEPECINLFIMKNEDIISRRGDLKSWRLRMNNEDLTDRPVNYQSPLAKDRLNMTLGNSNNTLHNSNERNQQITADEIGTGVTASYGDDNDSLLLIANPLPQTPTEKMIQVNINCATASLNKMCLFKECRREV